MKKKNNFEAIGRFFKLLYLKFYRSSDSPQKMALGFGLGVFLGIMPGLGVIAALVCAAILRVSAAGALLGTLVTNTWLSFLTLVLSTRVGAAVMGLNWKDVYSGWSGIIKGFSLEKLFQASVKEFFLPVIIGFIIVSACSGVIAYFVSLFVVIEARRLKKLRLAFRKENRNV